MNTDKTGLSQIFAYIIDEKGTRYEGQFICER